MDMPDRLLKMGLEATAVVVGQISTRQVGAPDRRVQNNVPVLRPGGGRRDIIFDISRDGLKSFPRSVWLRSFWANCHLHVQTTVNRSFSSL
jgi:hypothetical protein